MWFHKEQNIFICFVIFPAPGCLIDKWLSHTYNTAGSVTFCLPHTPRGTLPLNPPYRMDFTVYSYGENWYNPCMKLGIICSSGGHLLLIHLLKDFWSKHDRFWVTFDKEDARSLLREEKIYPAYFPTNRNILNLIRNFFLALRVLFKEKPDVIISSGAGVAIPFFYIGKLMRKKLIFIEAYERIENPSLTARVVYPITNMFILHWEEQKKNFPRGEVLGQLL